MSNFDVSGTDHSANAPTLLTNLLATIPANRSRRGYFVQNADASGVVQVAFYDGSGAGTPSIFVLAPGTSVGGSVNFQGTAPHTGVIKIFGTASTTKMTAREW